MKAYKGGKTSGGNKPTDPSLLRIIRELGKIEEQVVRNDSGHKYSQMLLKLIKPYESDRPGVDEIDDLLYVALNAWNLANLKKEQPTAFSMMYEEIRQDFSSRPDLDRLLDQMITHKEKEFSAFPLYIIEYELKQGKGDNATLTTKAATFEQFLADVMWGEDLDEEEATNYEPGYINRSIIMITPKEPFMNWLSNTANGSIPIQGKPEANVYLVGESFDAKEMEKWLKKNFDRLFRKELEDWYTDRKAWPVNRTYKMFREWFDVSYHLDAFDIEDYPVDKDSLSL